METFKCKSLYDFLVVDFLLEFLHYFVFDVVLDGFVVDLKIERKKWLIGMESWFFCAKSFLWLCCSCWYVTISFDQDQDKNWSAWMQYKVLKKVRELFWVWLHLLFFLPIFVRKRNNLVDWYWKLWNWILKINHDFYLILGEDPAGLQLNSAPTPTTHWLSISTTLVIYIHIARWRYIKTSWGWVVPSLEQINNSYKGF